MSVLNMPAKSGALGFDNSDEDHDYDSDDYGPVDQQKCREIRKDIISSTAETITNVDAQNTSQCPISSELVGSLTKAFSSPPAKDLGSLSNLPLEVVYAICLQLDVKSCLSFRQVNRRAREIVTSVNKYTVVTTHALGVVQAVLWSDLAPRVTFGDLYRLLCTHECMICSAPDSTDCFRFYDSRAPKHRPQIADGVKGLEVGRAALDRAVVSSVQATKAGGSKNKNNNNNNNKGKEMEGPGTKVPLKKKPTVLTALSMATKADGTDTTANETAAGLYVFLPTLTRCCKPCLEESPRLRVVPLASLRAASDLPRRHFLPYACVPWLSEAKTTKSKRGKSKNQSKIKTKTKTKAKSKTKSKTKSKSEPRGKNKSSVRSLAAYELRKIDTGMVTQDLAAKILFNAGFPSKRVEAVLYQSGYLDEFCWWDEVSSRSKFTVMMSFFDRSRNTAEGGYTCKACDGATQKLYGKLKVALVYSNTVFSTEEAFVDHFCHCPDAMEMYKTLTQATQSTANTADAANKA